MTNQVAIQPQTSMMNIIQAAMTSPEFKVEQLPMLLEFQKELMAKQAEIDFNAAMGRLSGKLATVKIARTHGVGYKNKQTGEKEEAFKYASYEDIDRAIRPLLADEGFSLSFTSEPRQGDGGGAVIIGTLSHSAGHSRKASMALPLDTSGGKTNIQGMGSTISYGKRYTVGMLLDIVTCADDPDNGGSEYVSNEQAVEIDLLITETKSDKVRFLKFIDAEEVQKIRVKDYPKAIAQLNAKKAAK